MQSRKTKHILLLVLLPICFLLGIYKSVFAADVVLTSFSNQSANGSGSNNSVISVGSYLQYLNRGDNSSIIGNYFTGYYYDNIFGFFKTDWSSDIAKNVRIISSTSKCPIGYGYKLGGHAYSSTAGFIDFDYNSNIFVYYCVATKTLAGYAYSPTTGFQNFNGISFNIEKPQGSTAVITGTGIFSNDTSSIKNTIIESQNQGSQVPEIQAGGSNFTSNTIQANKIEFESLRESLFYIIK